MNRIAKLDRREREELFLATAHDIKLPEAMAEKDFWVCWTLDYLFHQCPWAKHMAFKGGTSLSKCFGLIERFSEDIDLILDWQVLGYAALEPWAERSKTSQDKLNKEMDNRTCNFLREVFLPALKDDFAQMLSEPFKLFINDDEPQTLCFAYPRIYDDSAIVSVVRMEIGALAAWTPTQTATITSYAAERYPQAFKTTSTSVLTVMAERTFWEKVTILHKEAFRTNGKFPSRYSRHYYDLYCMDKSPVKVQAYADLPLLERVVEFKARFYPANAARYILLEIEEDANVSKLIYALSSPEYICLNPPDMPTPPPHLMFLKGYLPDGFAEKVYHIHVRYHGVWDELYFRDYLISHPETASEYAALKTKLHKDFEHDRDGYTKAKTAFIREVTEKARKL